MPSAANTSMPPHNDTGRPPGSNPNTDNMPPSSHSNFIHTDAHHPAASQNNSVEDYSRIMLEYTQRRMAGFADPPDDRGYATSRSSRSSNTSGQSGNSQSGILAGQAAGPGPTKLYRSRQDQDAAEAADDAGRSTGAV
ncbi:hypothetical protein BDV18DRAFT_161297 [Aspergillus unguis]